MVTPPTPIQAQQGSPQLTPSIRNRTSSHIQTNTPPSGQQRLSIELFFYVGTTTPHSTNSTSSDTSNPTLQSMRRQTFRNLRDFWAKWRWK